MNIGDKAETVGWILVGLGFLLVCLALERQNRRLENQAIRLHKAETRHNELADETRRAFTGWHRYFFARNQEPKA